MQKKKILIGSTNKGKIARYKSALTELDLVEAADIGLDLEVTVFCKNFNSN